MLTRGNCPTYNVDSGGAQMSSVKEEMTRIIQEQPDDSSFDEILRELALARMIDRGVKDSEAGRTISDDELKRQMNQWRK